jgi:hypothetical protein
MCNYNSCSPYVHIYTHIHRAGRGSDAEFEVTCWESATLRQSVFVACDHSFTISPMGIIESSVSTEMLAVQTMSIDRAARISFIFTCSLPIALFARTMPTRPQYIASINLPPSDFLSLADRLAILFTCRTRLPAACSSKTALSFVRSQ